jgi:hypothetical protein
MRCPELEGTDMPIPKRTMLKPESWPGGHRAALVVLLDLDPLSAPWVTPSPFANEAGAERLVAMFADLDIAPTVIIDSGAEDRFHLPEGTRCDAAAHIHPPGPGLQRAREAAKRRTGAVLSGAVLSGSEQPTSALDLEELWLLDGSGSPYPQRTDRGRVVVPYSPWWHDARWLSASNPSPPSAILEMWSVSLASVRTHGEVMTVMLSAEIAGHPGYLETFQRFFDEAIGAGDVWITNGRGIVSHVQPVQMS